MTNPPSHILVVDDQPDNLLILEDLLGDQYQVSTSASGEDALFQLAGGPPVDLVLLDAIMPGLDGFQLCQRIKAQPETRDIPVLFLTGLETAADEAFGLSLGAADFIHKPFSPPVVLARVHNQMQLIAAKRVLRKRNDDLERLVAERTREIVRQSAELARRNEQIQAAQSATITAFCVLAESRDNETGNHIRRTQNYVKVLAEHLRSHPRFVAELNDENILLLYKSAPLHDIGKVAIPDAVLHKPGKLTPDEWEIMKQHAQYGYSAIISAEQEFGGTTTGFLRYAREIAYGHHEKWDGSGYPQGISGDAIPMSARLMAVADVYDALISRRVYKPAFPHDEAVYIIAEGRGRHFDPDMVDAMLEISPRFQAIAQQYGENHTEANLP